MFVVKQVIVALTEVNGKALSHVVVENVKRGKICADVVDVSVVLFGLANCQGEIPVYSAEEPVSSPLTHPTVPVTLQLCNCVSLYY